MTRTFLDAIVIIAIIARKGQITAGTLMKEVIVFHATKDFLICLVQLVMATIIMIRVRCFLS